MTDAYYVTAEVMRRTARGCRRIHLLTSLATIIAALILISGCSRRVGTFSAAPEPDITGSSSDPAVDLKCELKPDRKYAFHLETDNSYSSSKWKFGIGSQEIHFETDYRLSVTNETKKAHQQLDVEFLALVLQVFSGDDTRLYFDSENKAVPMTDDFSEAMRNMIHTHFGAELSRHGNLAKVMGLDETVSAASAKKNFRRTGDIRRLFTTSNVRHMVELNQLPDKSVRVGDSWRQTNDLINGFIAVADCKFVGWQWHNERKCALIESKGTITPPNSSKSKTSVEDSQFSGRYWFDPEISMIADSIVHEQYTWSRSKGSDGEKFPTTRTISVKLDSISDAPKSVATN